MIITEGFRKHAAPGAIKVFLKRARANARRWENEAWALADLLDERRQQMAAGEWPEKKADTPETTP